MTFIRLHYETLNVRTSKTLEQRGEFPAHVRRVSRLFVVSYCEVAINSKQCQTSVFGDIIRHHTRKNIEMRLQELFSIVKLKFAFSDVIVGSKINFLLFLILAF